MMKSIHSFLGYDEPRDEVLNAGTNEGTYQPPSLDLSNFDDFPDIPVTISHEPRDPLANPYAAAPTTSENADRSYYPYFHTLEVIAADPEMLGRTVQGAIYGGKDCINAVRYADKAGKLAPDERSRLAAAKILDGRPKAEPREASNPPIYQERAGEEVGGTASTPIDMTTPARPTLKDPPVCPASQQAARAAADVLGSPETPPRVARSTTMAPSRAAIDRSAPSNDEEPLESEKPLLDVVVKHWSKMAGAGVKPPNLRVAIDCWNGAHPPTDRLVTVSRQGFKRRILMTAGAVAEEMTKQAAFVEEQKKAATAKRAREEEDAKKQCRRRFGPGGSLIDTRKGCANSSDFALKSPAKVHCEEHFGFLMTVYVAARSREGRNPKTMYVFHFLRADSRIRMLQF